MDIFSRSPPSVRRLIVSSYARYNMGEDFLPSFDPRPLDNLPQRTRDMSETKGLMAAWLRIDNDRAFALGALTLRALGESKYAPNTPRRVVALTQIGRHALGVIDVNPEQEDPSSYAEIPLRQAAFVVAAAHTHRHIPVIGAKDNTYAPDSAQAYTQHPPDIAYRERDHPVGLYFNILDITVIHPQPQ